MPYIQAKSMVKVNVRSLSHFVALSSVALFMPFFIHIQWITGPIINAILIITLFLVGVRSAIVLCLVPSLMALSGGLIPAILAPVVPFIMISNVILVLTIDYFYTNIKDSNKAYFVGLGLASFFKFAFLYYSVDLVVDLLVKKELATKITQLFSITQLLTALTGGLLAFVVLKFLKRL